jgi:hypothetical protein
MPSAQVQQLIRLHDKATGWMFVAAGALLIAVKETWELHELQEWPPWLFWALVALMLTAALGYTAARLWRGDALSGEAGAEVS